MKNILILLDYYLPNASANGICCSKVIEELKKTYNIFVLCYGNDTNKKNVIKDSGITIVKVPIRNNKHHNFIKKLLYHLKWLIPLKKYPPYTNKENINILYKESLDIINKYFIKTVICVHLPIETIIVGNLLKKKYNKLFVIAYMLDSLSGGFLPKKLPQSFCRRKRIKWEKNILSSYDKIILMNSSKKHHEKYTKNYLWYKKSTYLDIPMLTKKEINQSNNTKVIKFLYTGSLDKRHRNPSIIIKILKEINDENVYCEFIGSCNCEDDFSELKKIYGKRLLFSHHIPYEKIEKKIMEADILINIGNNNNNLLPSKIFEYMSYGKPIISTYEDNSEPSFIYLQKYPLSILIDGRKKMNYNLLKKQIYDFKMKRINMEKIYSIFNKNMPETFVKEIE